MLYILLSILPINLVSIIGGKVFQFLGPFTKAHKIAKKNYLHIFPNANLKEVNQQVKNSWNNIGKTFFELLILPKIIMQQNDKINLEGDEILYKLKKNNEQIIFFGIHQSNWEILLPTIDKIGFKVGGIYRHINNPNINKLILNQRKSSIASKKSFYTPKGKKSAKEIIEAINNKSSMILLIDQKDSAGENIKFFGSDVKTQIGFIKLARKYNMKIIPIENIRTKVNNFTIKFYSPLMEIKSDLSDAQVMEKIHHIIEGWIKKNPSEWFLQHNRFN